MKSTYRIIPCVALLLAACGSGPSGEYTADQHAFFDKLVFRSGGEVDIGFMGSTGAGSYKIDGKRVLVTVNGKTQVFEIDRDGCVDGGSGIGRYCKR
ncbi:hypothetical protein [Nevskia soli]|uniref:hypothetical protein n=1 Tax=Nevskia soli TaxID=418856 RepID=UPI0004A71424|nr:hypothetical protein [Nevskia soli]